MTASFASSLPLKCFQRSGLLIQGGCDSRPKLSTAVARQKIMPFALLTDPSDSIFDTRTSLALHGSLLRSAAVATVDALKAALTYSTLPFTVLLPEKKSPVLEKAHKLGDADSVFLPTVPQHIRVHAKVANYEPSFSEMPIPSYDALLLHGAMGSAFCYRNLLTPLSGLLRGQVAAFDRPPFGLSEVSLRPNYTLEAEAGLTASVSRALQLRSGRVVLIGHSLGGAVALRAAMDAMNGQIAGLVLLAPALAVPYPDAVRTAARAALAVPRVGRKLVRARMRRMAEHERMEGRLGDEAREGYTRPMRREHWDEGMREYLREFSGFSIWAWEKELSELRIPTLVVAAGGDSVVSENDLERLCRTMPFAKLHTLDGISHLMFEDDPDALFQAIERWARYELPL